MAKKILSPEERRAKTAENNARTAEYRIRWRAENKERVRATGKRSKDKHREEINASQRAAYSRQTDADRQKTRDRNAAWCADNPEKVAAKREREKQRRHQWEEENPQAAKDKNRQNYQRRVERVGLEQLAAEARAYAKLNPQQRYAINKKWLDANKEQATQTRASYRLENAAAVREWRRAWKKANVISVRAHVATRRSRTINGGRFTKEDVQNILAMQRRRCAMCRKKLKKNLFHIDHIMPLALGGSNNRNNVQILCPSCNCKKGAKHPLDFSRSRGFLL